MLQLDLHGKRHHEVFDLVEEWLLRKQKYMPVRVITGNSTPMKNIVMDVVKGYNWKFYTPANNLGEIIVIG